MAYSDQELDKFMDTIELFQQFHSFVFEDMLIRGKASEVADRFVKENPSDSLRVWLHDSGLVIKML